MNATDLRPAYPPRQLHLLAEEFECVRGRRYTISDCLESDGPKLQVFRFINLAHPAFADWANNAKTPNHEFARLEARAYAIQTPIG